MSSWSEIDPGILPSILSVLREQKFDRPTPIQSFVLPHFLGNKDVAVQAETGSGKTLAFVIPIIQKLQQRKEKWKKGETGAIVILPTRELAVQVTEVIKLFLPSCLSLQPLIGGYREVSVDIKSMETEGSVIVVATPGRLADLLQRKDCCLSSSVRSLEILVLDEADRLLDLGFEATLNTILSYLPKQRRTGLFSATLSQEVETLIRGGLRNPVNVSLSKGNDAEFSTPSTLLNYYVEVSADIKLTHLMTFLSSRANEKLIVFFATCAGVTYYSQLMKKLLPRLDIMALHGKMKQKRQLLFDKFINAEKGVLISTDVMARGIDIPDVDWVVQFDPPSSAKAFIHRCGRTARMGRSGQALVYLLPSESAYVQYMEISQRVILRPLSMDENLPNEVEFIENVRSLLAEEHELYTKSVRAFVSFVRFYHKHECSVIFNFKTLDLCSLAFGAFGLLHLPKMPELKGKDTSSFSPYPISVEDIPYKDKSKQRQEEKLKLKKEEIWSAKMEQRKAQRKKRNNEERRIARKSKRRKNHQFSAAELDELAEEARLLKRFKAGKITKEELEEQLDRVMETKNE